MTTVEKLSLLALAAALSLGSAYAQNSSQSPAPDSTASQAQAPQASEPMQGTQGTTTNNQAAARSYRAGEKVKIEGTIVKRNPDSLVLQTGAGEQIVNLTPATRVEERKSNPFRGRQHYAVTQLLRGLNIVVEGRTESSGAVDAQKIRFTKDEYKVAQSVETRVTPVEHRVQSAETRLTESEANQQRLAGQITELGSIANEAKAGARAAQQTGDMALTGVRAVNDRVSELDDYEAQKSTTVHFKVNSARLSPEARQQLDELADQAKSDKAYIIEVAGFASSDGTTALNRRLSRARAEAVVDYLEADHDIPLRRITMPFGYGSKKPVADNDTHDGRVQNRRVEVTILVNKGLTQQAQIGDVSMQSNSPSGPTPNNAPNSTNTMNPQSTAPEGGNTPANPSPTQDNANQTPRNQPPTR